jgi:hypothetical protein
MQLILIHEAQATIINLKNQECRLENSFLAARLLAMHGLWFLLHVHKTVSMLHAREMCAIGVI